MRYISSLALLALAASSAHAGPSITDAASPQRIPLTFTDRVGAHLTFELNVPAGTVVEVYPVGASGDTRRDATCTLTAAADAAGKVKVTLAAGPGEPGCARHLAIFHSGANGSLAISKQGQVSYAVLEFGVPAYAGKPDVAATRVDGEIQIHKSVQLDATNNACFVYVGGWREGVCKAGATYGTATFADANVRGSIAAILDGGSKSWLYVHAADANGVGLRRLPLQVLPPPPPPPPAKPPELIERCRTAIGVTASTTTDYICVDAYPTIQSLIVVRCTSAKPASCVLASDTARTNRSYLVSVWADDGVQTKATLDGTPGTSSGLYDPTKTAAEVGAPLAAAQGPKLTWPFSPRKAGTAKLVVTATRLKADGTPEGPVTSLDYSFQIQDLYRAAIRLGFAFSWMPQARRYGILATPDGQRYVAITEGSERGLFRTEIVSGFSWFERPIREGSLDTTLALGMRVGVLGLDDKVTALSSIMGGAELAIGNDLAIGVYGGLARHDEVNDGYEPGRTLPAAISEVPKHMTATPMLALVINFTPGLNKSLGVTK